MASFQETVKALQRVYGKKVILASQVPTMGRASTGSLALDVGLAGGWPKGKITVVNGRFSVTKTATAFHAIAEVQKDPEALCGWVSMEPFDRGWAETNGVDLNRLWVAEPETGEEAVNIYDAFLDTHMMQILVLDSLGALAPTYELENEAENGMMGTRTKLIKKLMMKTNARLQPTKEGKYNECVCIFLNHIYDSMDPKRAGPYTVAGGKSVWMFSSLMLTFSRKEFIWEGKEKESETIGLEVNVKTEKDKIRGLVQPFSFRYFSKDGWNGDAEAGTYDDTMTLIRYAQLIPSPENPYIKKAGSWYTLPGVDKPVQGDAAVWNFLTKNPEVKEKIEKDVRKKLLEEGIKIKMEDAINEAGD